MSISCLSIWVWLTVLKVRVNLGESHDEDGEVYGNKWLDMVIEDTHVYLASECLLCMALSIHLFVLQLEPSGEMHLIDASTAIRPSITNTWFISLIRSIFHKVTGKKYDTSSDSYDAKSSQNGTAPDIDVDDASSVSSEATGSGYSTPSKRGDEAKVRVAPTVKAGGMRRKNVRKR